MSDTAADFTLLTRKKRTAVGLALALETACRDFELMLRMLRREVAMASPAGEDHIAGNTVKMALAKSFVFNAARAVRLCDEGAGILDVPSDERKAFTKGLESVSLVRNVNEHGYDPKDHPRRKNSRPQMHYHELEGAAADETSLTILGEEKILMGPVNLFDVYPIVARMRSVAGFSGLAQEYRDP